MPGLNGLDVQKLISAKTSIPVIFITVRGNIPSTVTAMKGGAIDFLTKPVNEVTLLATIDRALELDRVNREEVLEHARLVARYESLTPREREVLPLLVKGLLNKQAAAELGITEYTVQIHRGQAFGRMPLLPRGHSLMRSVGSVDEGIHGYNLVDILEMLCKSFGVASCALANEI